MTKSFKQKEFHVFLLKQVVIIGAGASGKINFLQFVNVKSI